MVGETTTPKWRKGHLMLVVGAPGAGEGTMCTRIVSDDELRTIHGPGTSIKVRHISVGDLLRQVKAAGVLPHDLAEKVEKQTLMAGGDIVKIISSAGVQDMLNRGEVVILDGFPRNMDQLRGFEEKFGDPDLLVSLRCQRQLALERYIGRHDASRPDGDVALFEKRCDEFEREPWDLEYYKARCDECVLEVDVGSLSASIDDNYRTLKQCLVQHLKSPWRKNGG
ncbi:Adenylate kinase isoenzyme 1 [Cytospora mali]|uniref:Adenylate kinase isoenzyme 1 n=1 Tax=Cytospora mali TaxID=578113 RepID=A0A194UVW2_CYTMA|nr:Adenylate kinase isoenzyme 1 [Valsa mali var. pyri (nom. inval.)]